MAYATGGELKALLQQANVGFDRDDDLYDVLVQEASDAIDRACHRRFTVPTEPTARTFRATSDGREVLHLGDIASTADLAVAVDTSGSGSFTATSEWWADVDDESGMVTAIVSTGRFPCGRRPCVRVTAWWGWPAVPGPIHRATLIQAQRLYVRKESPAGVVGFGEMGAVRLSMVDPDVASNIASFVAHSRLIA